MTVRISTASGSERASSSGALATARGTDPASLPVHAIAIRSSIYLSCILYFASEGAQSLKRVRKENIQCDKQPLN